MELFNTLKSVLLESPGRRLSEIIRLMIAVESAPPAEVIASVRPSTEILPGAADLFVPKDLGWTWLVLWLATEANPLPTALRTPNIAGDRALAGR